MEPDYTADRQSAIDWARAVLADETTVILDSETTGLRSGAEICQIAVIDTRGQVLLDTLVRPVNGIPAEATAIHGITDEQVTEAPPFTEVALGLWELLRDRRVVVYNASFDARLIHQSLAAHEVNPPGETDELLDAAGWECAMVRYAAYCGDWNPYFGDYRFQKLPNATHSAVGDCRATLRVIERMAGVANAPITVLVPEEHAEGWRLGARYGGASAVLAAFIADVFDGFASPGERAELAQAWWYQYTEPQARAVEPISGTRRTQRPVVHWEPIPESKEATDRP